MLKRIGKQISTLIILICISMHLYSQNDSVKHINFGVETNLFVDNCIYIKYDFGKFLIKLNGGKTINDFAYGTTQGNLKGFEFSSELQIKTKIKTNFPFYSIGIMYRDVLASNVEISEDFFTNTYNQSSKQICLLNGIGYSKHFSILNITILTGIQIINETVNETNIKYPYISDIYTDQEKNDYFLSKTSDNIKNNWMILPIFNVGLGMSF
ncbi:MAG: hypothetical protein BWY22_00214 [Bacteroidetes bacterium ADurb.Bin217]|nr:MAG: hypothetical protein BWY22_00214 [Bacteroidetes bacterium ADurb.Bin217]